MILSFSFTYTGCVDDFLMCSDVTPCLVCAWCSRSAVGHLSVFTTGIRSGPLMSKSFELACFDLCASSGVIIIICGSALTAASTSRSLCFSCSHELTALLHPFRDSKSQKWLSAPGMCTVSNVYDLRYSAHRLSRSRAATDIADARVGSSKMYVNDLWSFTDANGKSPNNRCRCLSTEYRIG